MPEKKKILGFSKPVFFGILVLLIALLSVGFLLDVEKPAPELPAEAILHIGEFAVTNTMLASWLTIAFLGIFFWAATRRMSIIPKRFQTAAEFIIEYLYNFCKDIAGEKNGRRFFPLVATIFLYVIVNAWMNLIPGYGTILVAGEEHSVHLLRGANTDINVPLMLALVSFAVVTFWGLQSQRLHFLETFVNVRKLGRGLKQFFTGDFKRGAGNIAMGAIYVFIGFIELLSYLIRIVSFTFRLFGNMTAGEILVLSILFLVPFVLGTLFYGFEMFFGFIQALIFAGLTLVFAYIAVTPHEPEAESGH